MYHHLFEHSGGNHIFPLIAAHGALWARGYFAFGTSLGRCLAFPSGEQKRQRHLAALEAFANAFRDINRRVCIDTYANYHFVGEFGDHPDAVRFVKPELLTALNRLHAARRQCVELSDPQKRNIFQVHFLNEQENVVAPSIGQATTDFQWPLMKFLAIRPLVRFAYFPGTTIFWFRRFDRTSERIQRGLQAFDIGSNAGWHHVESTLRNYQILPDSFFVDSAAHVHRFVRRGVFGRCGRVAGTGSLEGQEHFAKFRRTNFRVRR